MPVLLIVLGQPREHVEHVVVEPGVELRRVVQALHRIERAPQLDGGGEHVERVAREIDVAGVGKELGEQLEPRGVGRRLHHQPLAVMLQHQPPVEPHIGVGPCLPVGLRHALEVEIVAVGGAESRPRAGDIGRALAQHHHAELLFLRAVEADRHVVLRALLRQKHLHHPVEMAFGQEEMVREEALIGGGVSEIGIDREEVVQERGAGAPMADDEDGRRTRG